MRKYTYDEVKCYLKSLGYFLDDKTYINCNTYLTFHDKQGYKYYAPFANIVGNKKYSPNKVYPSNPYSIENINTYLLNLNKKIKCTSTKYLGKKSKLDFICLRCGTKITNTWGNINRTTDKITNRRGIICPNCDERIESLHALILKQVWVHEHPDTVCEDKTCRSIYTGKILPTDIVNHRLKIAIEIQSQWHDIEEKKKTDAFKKNYWIEKGYSFYDPDIRKYTIVEMIQLFFPDIYEIPDYINMNYSNKINIKQIQELLNKNISVTDISNNLHIGIHRIYDAIYSGKLHYSESYTNPSYSPIVQFNLDGEYLRKYASIEEAAKNNHVSSHNISQCLQKNRNYSSGYLWAYEKDYLSKDFKLSMPRCKNGYKTKKIDIKRKRRDCGVIVVTQLLKLFPLCNTRVIYSPNSHYNPKIMKCENMLEITCRL